MGRMSTQFVCQGCGGITLKWAGKCEHCGQWNTLVEEVVQSKIGKEKASQSGLTLVPLENPLGKTVARMPSTFSEFDRVTGGGLVPGAVILLGGDPGIGKSTLLLQIMASLNSVYTVAYVSGEEGLDQIRMRAERLGISPGHIKLASSNRIADIMGTLGRKETVSVLVVDSIQTMSVDDVEAAAGTVSQIRATSQALITLAKNYGITIILVGHVTKEGMLAGPRILEHMVDTVLYFEGERGHPFRLLRAVKNRFGATDEIGVFDMTEAGLIEVTNPSELFLSNRQEEVTGSCVFAGIEGTRPLLVEIQALVSPSFLPSPRRAVVGWDPQRLSMVLAVLEARCGLNFSGKDVYLSVLGGLRVSEPAADLAVAAALLSCIKNRPIPQDLIVFGEISLSGEVRPVNQREARLKEAAKLGFQQAMAPPKKTSSKPLSHKEGSPHLIPLSHVHQLVQWFENATQKVAKKRPL